MSIKMQTTSRSSLGAGPETAAFEGLVERYQRVLFTVALRMLGDYDAANDAAQNAFVKAYRKLETFDPTRRFFSWIYRIVVNECLNVRRVNPPHEPLAPDLAAVAGRTSRSGASVT